MSRRRSAAIMIACAIALACGTACRPAASDATRRTPASAPSPSPHRIVSLIPATTEMLFAMHAGDRVVAVSSYDTYPPDVARLPRVGGLLDPYIEPLLALKPDLVIVYSTQDELRQRLDQAGIPMFLYSHRELADITATMRQIGDRIGLHNEADAAARNVEQRLADVGAKVASRPKIRTLLVFGREPGTLNHIEASGGYGFLHDLVELAGGADVLGDIHQPKVDMSAEMILARAPDAVVELHYGDFWNADRIEVERATWNRLESLPAVKSRHVHFLVGNEFVVPGPRVVEAAQRLAETLHPEAYEK